MQAVIMAGGKGTRLLSLTNNEIPKPMVEVCGKPILLWQIEKLKENNIKDIILIVGHLKEVIIDYFKDGKQFGVNISYIEENKPLGSAGALSLLKKDLIDDKFLLIFGDVIFDIDINRMIKFHESNNSFLTLFVHPNVHPYDSDLVVIDEKNKVLKFDSKHNVRDYFYKNLVNAGFYVMNSSICDYVEENIKTDLEKELIPKIMLDGKFVYAYKSSEYIKDVGTVDRITKAENEIKNGLVSDKCYKNKQKAIFIDRDGTINKYNGLVYKQEQFKLEYNVVEAIRVMNDSGYLAICITNQPVVARGLCKISDLEQIHAKLETLLGKEGVYLDDIKYCPHHPDKGYPEENKAYKIECHCRKPDIGLIEECVDKYNIDLSKSWFVGDTSTDIKTGQNASVKTILLKTGLAGNDGKYDVKPDYICDNLLEATRLIIGE